MTARPAGTILANRSTHPSSPSKARSAPMHMAASTDAVHFRVDPAKGDSTRESLLSGAFTGQSNEIAGDVDARDAKLWVPGRSQRCQLSTAAAKVEKRAGAVANPLRDRAGAFVT